MYWLRHIGAWIRFSGRVLMPPEHHNRLAPRGFRRCRHPSLCCPGFHRCRGHKDRFLCNHRTVLEDHKFRRCRHLSRSGHRFHRCRGRPPRTLLTSSHNQYRAIEQINRLSARILLLNQPKPSPKGHRASPYQTETAFCRSIRLDRLGQSIVHRSLKEGRRPPT